MVIFGTGVVTGGLLVQHSERIRPVKSQHAPTAAQRSPSTPGNMRVDLLRRMSRELDLTPEQRERVDKILKESQERTKKIMEPVAPQLRAEVQQTKEQFRAVLTTAQQARFDELLKQQQHAREPRRGAPARERPGATNAPTTAP